MRISDWSSDVCSSDLPAAATVLTDQRIRIADGKIVSVAPWQASANDGAVVDWSGYTVLPGLIDLHTHVADGAISSSRSEERRVGKECVSPCRSRWSPYP